MIFRTQLRRQAVVNWLLMFIPDLMISAAVATYTHGGVLAFGLTFVVLFALGLVYWILRSITLWTAWLLFGRKVVEKHVYDYLVTNRYPAPGPYEGSPQEYFSRIMNDETLAPDLRIKAALEVGTFAAYSGALEYQQLAKINLAAESAIENYSRRSSVSAE
jgi:hypothetical protein